ncbi:hypothetical protein [Ekhidna sp.]|jgi:peroxiredoxin|uniref:hypothetical protein n=1 Tax=Ekhidna sp. TaxID=2608089 RepID=UPI0032EF6497
MKKKIVLGFGLLIILLIVWMGYKSVQNLETKTEIDKNQNNLSSVLANLGAIGVEPNKATILVYFNSECEICHWEMKHIAEHLVKLERYQLILTSFEPEDEAIEFLEKHGLTEFYIKSTPKKVMSTFSGGVPQLFVYDKGKLKKNFKGEVKIEAILNSIESQ